MQYTTQVYRVAFGLIPIMKASNSQLELMFDQHTDHVESFIVADWHNESG